jgi:hypothetical protein
LTGWETFTAGLRFFRAAKVTNAGEAVLAIAVALAAIGWVVDAPHKVGVADHAAWAIFIATALCRLGFGIAVADTPVFDAFRVVTAIAVVATAAIDFETHTLETTFSIGAIAITSTRLAWRSLTLFTSIGLRIALFALGTGTVRPTNDPFTVHRDTDLRVALYPPTFGALGAIAIIFTANQTDPTFGSLHTAQAVGTNITAIAAGSQTDTFETDGWFGTVTIGSAAGKGQLTSPINAGLITRAVAVLSAALRP